MLACCLGGQFTPTKQEDKSSARRLVKITRPLTGHPTNPQRCFYVCPEASTHSRHTLPAVRSYVSRARGPASHCRAVAACTSQHRAPEPRMRTKNERAQKRPPDTAAGLGSSLTLGLPQWRQEPPSMPLTVSVLLLLPLLPLLLLPLLLPQVCLVQQLPLHQQLLLLAHVLPQLALLLLLPLLQPPATATAAASRHQ